MGGGVLARSRHRLRGLVRGLLGEARLEVGSRVLGGLRGPGSPGGPAGVDAGLGVGVGPGGAGVGARDVRRVLGVGGSGLLRCIGPSRRRCGLPLVDGLRRMPPAGVVGVLAGRRDLRGVGTAASGAVGVDRAVLAGGALRGMRALRGRGILAGGGILSVRRGLGRGGHGLLRLLCHVRLRIIAGAQPRRVVLDRRGLLRRSGLLGRSLLRRGRRGRRGVLGADPEVPALGCGAPRRIRLPAGRRAPLRIVDRPVRRRIEAIGHRGAPSGAVGGAGSPLGSRRSLAPYRRAHTPTGRRPRRVPTHRFHAAPAAPDTKESA